MALEWLNVPLDTPVGELIARGRRSRAIEALRQRLQGRLAPSPEVRLQLVDLLIEAERGGEAVPILLGLADEFAKDGFVAKAVAVLKRVAATDPGRADVERRLAKLVKQQQEAEEPAPASVELGLNAAEPIARASEPARELAPKPAAPPAPAPLPAPPVQEPSPPSVENLPLVPIEAPAVEASGGLRGIVRRFVRSLTAADAEATPVPIPDPEPLIEVEAEPEPEPRIEPAPPEAALPQTAPPEISEAAFQEQLLDLAEHVVRQAPAPQAAPPAPDRSRIVLYAERLLASALFQDLTEEELLVVVHDLRLLTFAAGDVVVSEGEKSEGLFIVAAGSVKVFVRSPTGRNVAVAELPEGQFFGEIASLSGRPRSATVTAAAHTELLVLDAPALQSLTTRHPRIGRVLEDSYVERASSPDVAAVRAVRLADQQLRRRADEVLSAHFGQSRWDPRMKLRLADLLLRTDKEDDAVAVLVGLADDFAREGFPEKAVAVLKKIERIRTRNIEEVSLAPLAPEGGEEPRPEPAIPAAPSPRALPVRPRLATEDFLQAWLVDVLRDRVHQVAMLEPVGGYRPGLKASPLFEGLADDELLALIRGLRLLSAEAGDILVSEGEPGESVFILASGQVRIFVSGAGGRAWPIGTLGEGSFFGELAALWGQPRSATVVASSACELLELERPALDRIAVAHPRVRKVLESVGAARSQARASLAQPE
jgi:CRP-like cAMP-binding protein